MLFRGETKISRNLSKQAYPIGSGRITLKNFLRDYPHLLKSPNFRLLVFKCAGSYSRVFTVFKIVFSCTYGVLLQIISENKFPFGLPVVKVAQRKNCGIPRENKIHHCCY